jgi:hypothetical protein
LICINGIQRMSAMLEIMGKGALKRFAFAAAAVLALAMLLSACGAFDAHAAAPDEPNGSCCASVYGTTAADPTDAAPPAKGGAALLPPASARSPIRAPQPAVPKFTSKVLPPSSFYARSARILR